MQAHARQECLRSGSFRFHVISFDSVSLQGLKVERFGPLFTEGN